MSQVFDALRKAERARKNKAQTEMQPGEPFTSTTEPATTSANSQATATSAPDSNATTDSYLGPALRVKGQITGNGHLQIDGKLQGNISLHGYRVTVGPAAHVSASITASEVVVRGQVDGDLRASDRIEITKDATVAGELIAARILIEDGAHIKAGIQASNRQAEPDLKSVGVAAVSSLPTLR
jgi:cytoskeletal protein CcmA (bactofilin family)